MTDPKDVKKSKESFPALEEAFREAESGTTVKKEDIEALEFSITQNIEITPQIQKELSSTRPSEKNQVNKEELLKDAKKLAKRVFQG